MVKIQQVKVEHIQGLSFTLYLPSYPLYIITTTKTMLLPQVFQATYFQKQSACVIIANVKKSSDLLENEVIAINEKAKQLGVKLGITGKEALLYCEKQKEKLSLD